MKQQITPMDLRSVNTMLYELTCLRRWSEVFVDPGKYTELAKQAFNSMIAYFWACEAVYEGISIDWTIFPKIAISRGFVKSYQCDIPEHNLERIFELGNVSKNDFSEKILEQIRALISEDFNDLLAFNPECIEARIYKAATKLGTIIELQEIQNGISKKEYTKKLKQLQHDFKSFSDLPGYEKMQSENYMEVFRDYSQLRNRIRWAKHPNIIKNSVLGHHFDVAVFSYLMYLEVNPTYADNPSREAIATRYFFIGIFHDFPEKWTGDMPSPVKDSIPGLRHATEEFENEVMEENVYSLLPDYLVKNLRYVMLEDECNASYKAFSKISDYFGAYVECWRELDAGSRHGYYLDVMKRDFDKKEDLPQNFRLLTEELYGSVYFH